MSKFYTASFNLIEAAMAVVEAAVVFVQTVKKMFEFE